MLEQFKQQAIQAHYHTSFSPEKRGENMVQSYGEELEEDIKELEAAGVDSETVTFYVTRYERNFSSWLGAKSRCISSMITGPSNFPVRRAQKANRSEENHYQLFRVWREKAKKAIIRKAGPVKTFSSELDRYKAQLNDRERSQEYMKTINKYYKAFKKDPSSLETAKIHSSAKEFIKGFVPKYSFEPLPYARYQMTNNLANIKRIKERIAELEKKEQLSTSVGEREFPFEGGVVVLNHSIDRVQIKHDQKPSREVIQKMKEAGFKWAPSNVAWQRHLNSQGIYKAKIVTGVDIPVSL
jgi:ribosomal protein L9